MNDTDHAPTESDPTFEIPAGAVLFVGEEVAVLARPWQHGDRTGITVERTYVYRRNASPTMLPDTTTERLAEMLATGELREFQACAPNHPSSSGSAPTA